MRKLKITAEFLERYNPCVDGARVFVRRFPNGVEITDDQETNFEIVQKIVDNDRTPMRDRCPCCGPERHAGWLSLKLSDGLVIWPETTHDNGIAYLVAGMLADAVGVYLERQKA